MKKHLLMMAVGLMLAVCAQARIITPAENQLWWGYFNESDFETNDGTIGTGSAMALMAGIYIPANHEQLGKATIKAVRIYFDKDVISSLSALKIWISKELPTKISEADYVQNPLGTLTADANDYRLSTPFEINNSGFYIGYYVKSSTGYFIRTGGDDAANSFWIGNPEAGMSWQDLNGVGLGKLAFQILVEGGDFEKFCATAEDFKPAVVGLGESVDIPVAITNMGTETIKELSYTITVNGETSDEQTISSLSIPYGAKQTVLIPFASAASEGTFTHTLTITKVNGEDNMASNKTAKGSITTVENLRSWPRNVLIEEFTTEKCVYCPGAASTLHSFLNTYPDLASRVAVACHHEGYYTDWLTVSASTSYLWFYGSGGSYAPAFMYDRYASDGQTPVEGSQSNVAGLKSRIEARLAQPSYANIELDAEFNEAKTKIKVTAQCERAYKFCDTPARITLFLTEDNITAQSQTGASGTFIHQHVLRAVNTTWGRTLTWSNNTSSFTYTFSLNSAWKTDNLKVIAFVSGYDSKDITNCVVENCAVTEPRIATGVRSLLLDSDEPADIYSVDGRKLQSSQKGINLVRMGDGTVKKVLVK